MVRAFRASRGKNYRVFNPGRLVPQGGTVIERRFEAQNAETPGADLKVGATGSDRTDFSFEVSIANRQRKRTDFRASVAALVLLIGMTDGAKATCKTLPVPAPWTPVTYQSNTLEVWGRRYVLRSSIFPQEIASRGLPLLDGPIRFICRLGNGRFIASGKGATKQPSSPGSINLSESLSFNQNIRASVTLHASYDGLLVYHIQVNSRPGVVINSLSLEIPFRADIASYFQKYILMNQDWGKQATHAIPSRRGLVWQSPFNPYIWIGNQNEGLLWFCQSAAEWRTASSPLRFVRSEHALKFVISLINVPTSISHGLHFDFGLQATPTRPLPLNWRSLGIVKTWPSRNAVSAAAFRTNPEPGIVILWPDKEDWKWFGFPEPRDPQRMKALIRSFHAEGIKVLAYVQAEAMASNLPAYRANIAAWQYLPQVVDSFSPDVLAMGGPIHAVNPASGWAEFFLKHLQQFLNTYDVDGLYLDNIYLYPDANRRQVPAGIVYPVLGLRNLLQSVYRMVKQRNSHDIVIMHISGHDLTPVISYSDVILDGEHVASRPWTCQTYWNMLSLEEFQGEFAGWQWGPAPMYLSTLGYKKGCLDSYQPSDDVLAYALVHGDLLWGRFEDNMLARVYQLYKTFGVADAQFVPYWNASRYVHLEQAGPASNREVKASLYLARSQSSRQALLVVANLGPGNRTVGIKLNLDAADITHAHRATIWWFDAQTHEFGEDLRAGAFRLSVPQYSFRLVEIN